jgi:hypothetical protein
VVREASNEWAVLVERCYHALDHDRIEFRDVTGRCSVASAGAAALGLGVCILLAPEIIIGAVIVTGAVVVAVAIKEELDAYRRASRESAKPEAQTRPIKEPTANRKPEPSGQDWFPPAPTDPLDRERPECRPIPVPHAGGNAPHNDCADLIPQNNFPGWDVLVNGKQFDALVLVTRTLWDVKTDNFDIHSPRSQAFFAKVKLPGIQREKKLAEECGYDFVVGVKSTAHKAALLRLDPKLNIVVMNWC